MSDTPWLRELLRFALEATPSSGTPWDHNNTVLITNGGGDLLDPDDPGKDPRFRKLVEAILWGRKFLKTYNIVLAIVLLTVCAWHQIDRMILNKRRQRMCNFYDREGRLDRRAGADDAGASSRSSSTIQGNVTPPDAPGRKVVDVNETSPLLSSKRTRRNASWIWKPYYILKALLQYQPPPIPIVNKTLPTNAVTLFVLAWLGLVIFYNFFNMPLSFFYLFVFADRCGIIFISNLPLLYLLAAKTQPVKLLTGYSYESLNIFHRRVGEVMCFEALLHLSGMFAVWYGLLSRLGFTLAKFIFNRVVLLGLAAFISYELIYFTSLGSFRKRWYEIFLATHIILQVAGLVFLWFHHYTSRPYVGISLAIFFIDRLVYRLWLKSSTHTATLTVLEDDETILLSSNWEICNTPVQDTTNQPLLASLFTKLKNTITPKNMTLGWRPNQHIFITTPTLSRKYALQSHPFTIFSAAPLSTTSTATTSPKHAWFTLLVRPQSTPGFTHTLLQHARNHPDAILPIRLDGPYGSLHAPLTLEASHTAIIIAGGSGIAVAYPLLYNLVFPTQTHTRSYPRKIKLCWITHDPRHRLWLEADKVRELEDAGVEVFVPAPTVLAGRPDVRGILGAWVGEGPGRVGVVVSGPDGLVRDVRNVCAGEVARGRDVSVQVEKFGW